ncbi:MAG: TRAFs-binding domain-containing protein [Ilumatobacteraceae bacterium]
MSDSDVAAQVRRLIGRTEYLAAFDVADRALAEQPHDVALQHLAVLALARAGATDNAADRLMRSGLLAHADECDDELAEDVLALEARVSKDRAFAAPTNQRRALAEVAAAQYDVVFERFHRTYTGINAATMWCAAGQQDRARTSAAEVLSLLSADVDYWAAATRAEALLLLGDLAGVYDALTIADAANGDLASRASTRRQLAMICDELGIDTDVLRALAVPSVVHYCGHLPGEASNDAGRMRGDDEQRVARLVRAFMDRHRSVIAHGSLAAGADIIIAEAVLEAGGEVHVVLPFPAQEFELSSVRDAGVDWLSRYRSCLERVTSSTVVTARRHGDDDAAYAYCSAIAMGTVVVQARFMAARAEQLAVWDGQPPDGEAGTAADVARWRRTGLPSTIVDVASTTNAKTAAAPSAPTARGLRALLFADVKGYSSLADEQIPVFVAQVLGPLSRVLDRAGIHFRNGWGDALYLVIDDVSIAADVALSLQEAMESIDLERVGLPALRLRVGVHAGPVLMLHDPVRDEPSFFGEHVTRAARIEPVTPPGAVFVTSAFASLLALDDPDSYVCEYVGQVPMAKNYDTVPMHHLRRSRPSLP